MATNDNENAAFLKSAWPFLFAPEIENGDRRSLLQLFNIVVTRSTFLESIALDLIKVDLLKPMQNHSITEQDLALKCQCLKSLLDLQTINFGACLSPLVDDFIQQLLIISTQNPDFNRFRTLSKAVMVMSKSIDSIYSEPIKALCSNLCMLCYESPLSDISLVSAMLFANLFTVSENNREIAYDFLLSKIHFFFKESISVKPHYRLIMMRAILDAIEIRPESCEA